MLISILVNKIPKFTDDTKILICVHKAEKNFLDKRLQEHRSVTQFVDSTCNIWPVVTSVREQLKELTKQYDKSENDLKALQSVGQVKCIKIFTHLICIF